MKFLVEKSLLTDDQQYQYNKLNTNKKSKYITKFLQQHPNSKNLKKAQILYADSLIDNGFDDSKNKFITFMNNVKQDLPYNVVNLIKYFIDNNDLDPNQKWLYKPSLYTEDENAILYKLKAMVYASNSGFQKNADREMTPESLMDKTGKIKSSQEIKNILNRVSTYSESQKTIQNAIDRLYGYKNLTNANNVAQIKNKLISLIRKDKRYKSDMDSKILGTNIEELMKIPVTQPTENGMRVGIMNYLLGNTRLVSKKQSGRLDINALANKFKKSIEQVQQILTDAKDSVEDDYGVGAIEATQALVGLGLDNQSARAYVDKVYKSGDTAETVLQNVLSIMKE